MSFQDVCLSGCLSVTPLLPAALADGAAAAFASQAAEVYCVLYVCVSYCEYSLNWMNREIQNGIGLLSCSDFYPTGSLARLAIKDPMKGGI